MIELIACEYSRVCKAPDCQCIANALKFSSSYHNQIFDKRAGAGASPTSVGIFPGNWLTARIVDLTPVLQVLLS